MNQVHIDGKSYRSEDLGSPDNAVALPDLATTGAIRKFLFAAMGAKLRAKQRRMRAAESYRIKRRPKRFTCHYVHK